MTAQVESRGTALLFLSLWDQNSPRGGLLGQGKETRCPLYRRLDGRQGLSGRLRKMWPSKEQKTGHALQ